MLLFILMLMENLMRYACDIQSPWWLYIKCAWTCLIRWSHLLFRSEFWLQCDSNIVILALCNLDFWRILQPSVFVRMSVTVWFSFVKSSWYQNSLRMWFILFSKANSQWSLQNFDKNSSKFDKNSGSKSDEVAYCMLC